MHRKVVTVATVVHNRVSVSVSVSVRVSVSVSVSVRFSVSVTFSMRVRVSWITCDTPSKAYTFARSDRRAAEASRVRRALSRSNATFC